MKRYYPFKVDHYARFMAVPYSSILLHIMNNPGCTFNDLKYRFYMGRRLNEVLEVLYSRDYIANDTIENMYAMALNAVKK